MKDIRVKFLQKFYRDLQEVGIPVYSVIPSNENNPFIYIGDISTYEQIGKSHFHIGGTVTIEMFTGTREYTGSLKQALSYYNSIKYLLKPTKLHVPSLFGFTVSTWVLENDNGLERYSNTEKMFVGTLVYRFTATEHIGYIERVLNNGGTVKSIDCLPIEMR